MKQPLSFIRISIMLLLVFLISTNVKSQNWSNLGSPFPMDLNQGNQVDANGVRAVAVDMAVAKNGNVYVLHKMINQGQYRLYQSIGNGVWKPVGNSISVGFPGIALALDSSGIPYVAHIGWEYGTYESGGYPWGYTINVLKFNGTEWMSVGNPIPFTKKYIYQYIMGYRPSISLTVFNNTPFISYGDYSFGDANKDGKVSVKKLQGNQWINVGSNGFSAEPINYSSIKVGTDGLPVVLCHSDSDTGNVVAMKYTGLYWEKMGPIDGFAKNKFINNLHFGDMSCSSCPDKWLFNEYYLTSQNSPFKFVLDASNNPYVLLNGRFIANGQNSAYQSQLCWFNTSSGNWSNLSIPNSTNSAYFGSGNFYYNNDSTWIHQFDDILISGSTPWIVSTFANGDNYETRVKKKNGSAWLDMGVVEQNPNEFVGYFLGKDKNDNVFYAHSPYDTKKYCGATLVAPASISGSASVSCNHAATTYTASAVAGAMSYTWILPTGWTGSSTTNTITVTPGSNSGTISVAANNACGTGASKTLFVTVIGEAAKPASIIGSNSIACNGTGTYSVNSEYSVFADAFNRSSAVQPISNGGAPVMTYTTTTTSTGSASSTGATSRANLQSGTDYALQILSGNSSATPTAQTAGATYVTGSLSSYGSLFNNTLSTNAGPVIWTFNLKTNRSTALSGFAASGYASAVVLASTNSALHNTGNGYAVIEIKGTTTNTIKLIKYTNGLAGTQTVLAAPTSDYLSTNTNWASVKVVYNPTNHQWKMYLRSDGTTANSDFSSVTTQVGTTIADSSYSKVACGTFGFFFNHSASTTPTSSTALFDNFNVAVSPSYTYQWAVPNLWSGSSSTSSINITAAANPGTISVKSINACGASEAQTIDVGVTGTTRFNYWSRGIFDNNIGSICPNQPSILKIDTIQGSAPANYRWIVPSNWSGSSDSSSITFTNNGTSGSIGICFTRGCAISDSAYYSLPIESLAGTIDSVYGNGLVCPSSPVIYHVEPVLGAASYLWTLPSGWSGTSTSDSIVVTPGANSGNITVSAVNACGVASTSKSRFIQAGGAMSASINSNSGNVICSVDQNVVFTAFSNAAEAPTENSPTDSSITYTWKRNGIEMQNYYTIYSNLYAPGNSLQDKDTISCTISSSKACLTNNPATSNTIIMTVNPYRQHYVLHNSNNVTFENTTGSSCLGSTSFVVTDADLTQSITWYKNEFDTVVSLTTNDLVNNPSRKIIAGNANSMSGSDGVGLWQPAGIYLMPDKTIYIADKANNRVQKWTNGASFGTTVAGGHGYGNTNLNNEDSTLTEPNDVTVVNNTLYISSRNKIQKWVEGSYEGVTLALASDFNSSVGFSSIAYHNGYVYSAIPDKHVIMRWNVDGSNPAGEMVAGVYGEAGDDQLHLNYPNSVYFNNSNGGEIYYADRGNYRVQMLLLSTLSSPYIPPSSQTVAGGNGYGNSLSQLQDINDIYVDANRTVYISDKGWNTFSRIIKWKNGDTSGGYYEYYPLYNSFMTQSIYNSSSSLSGYDINSIVIDGSSTYFSYSNAVQKVITSGGSFVPTSPGNYQVQIIDQYGCRTITSAPAIVMDTIARVQAALEYGGSSVNSSLFCQGRYANFYAIAYNGGESASYQWYKNGAAIPFATDSTYFAAIATTLNSTNSETLNEGDEVYCKMFSTEGCVVQQEVTSNTITVHLTANSSRTIDSVVCQHIPFVYTYNGSNYLNTDSAGTYTVAIPNAAGCDSIITFNLTFTATKSFVTDTISYTQLPYNWHDTTITVDNIYIYDIGASFNPEVTYWPYVYQYHTLNAAGCDSLVTLMLYIVPPYRTSENVTICNNQLPYTWRGMLIDTATTHYDEFIFDNTLLNGMQSVKQLVIYKEKKYTSSIGIDSIINLYLSIKVYDSTRRNISASGSYTLPWGNTVYASGSYSYNYSSIYGCDSVVTIQLSITSNPTVTLNVKAYLQGFYTGGGLMSTTLFDLGTSNDNTATDSIRINLWSAGGLGNPNPAYTTTGILHKDGTCSILFPSTVTGGSYYIALKHRNSIETWSANPVSFSSNTTSYDFTTGLNKAYSDGVNASLKAMPDGNYAFYGGDVNQDGTVDGSDMNEVDNNSSIATFGYNNSDANGDGATDGLDMNIIDNNTQLGLFFARPY